MKLVTSVSSTFLNDSGVSVVPILGSGSVNRVFIVETADQKIVVRTREGVDALNEYKKEAWCIRNADLAGIPTAKVHEVGFCEDAAYMILEFIGGVIGRKSIFPRSYIWRELGRLARLVHSIPVAGFGLDLSDLTKGNYQTCWSTYLNYNIASLDEDDRLLELKVLTHRESKIIRTVFEELQNQSFSFGLNHGDLSLKNVVVDEHGKVHLLDWGSAEAAIVPHHDLIQLLKMNMLEQDPDSVDIQSFLDGYEISSGEFQEMLPTLESLLLLRSFHKLRWAIDQRVEGLESYVIHARQSVKRKLYQ